MEMQDILKYDGLLKEFWVEWFNAYLGREVFKDNTRVFLSSPSQFLKYVEDCKRKRVQCWVTAQPFLERDMVASVEKFYFDFDSPKILEAYKEANMLADTLRENYNAEPLLTYSGRKGYHCYVWLQKPVCFDENGEAKLFYETAQKMILSGLKFQTLDMQVIGDVKRFARVPYTVHEKTANPAVPIKEGSPCLINSLAPYRKHGLPESFTKLCYEKMEKAKRRTLRLTCFSRNVGEVRPCVQAALEKPLDGKNGHLMRLAIAREYLALGCSLDEIVELFRSQADFNPQKTRYYIEYARDNKYNPFKCATIRQLGYCLPNCPQRKNKLEFEGRRELEA
ncbi:MAG: hypothetical protein ACUVQW_04515 [Candidatus Bathycorpusculaceae bacterium]